MLIRSCSHAWLTDFHREAHVEAPRGPRRQAPTVLWDVDNAPVSLAGSAHPLPAWHESGRCTRPSSCADTAMVRRSLRQLRSGRSTPGRSTSCSSPISANPVSNSIYQRIGFKPVSDWLRIDFPPGR